MKKYISIFMSIILSIVCVFYFNINASAASKKSLNSKKKNIVVTQKVQPPVYEQTVQTTQVIQVAQGTNNNTINKNNINKYNLGSILENITYKTIENKELKMDIYMPNAVKFEKAPVVVYVHGGFWALGDKKAEIPPLMPIINKLRDDGFVFISIDYRLADGKTVFPSPLEDVKDAVRYIRKNAKEYNIDENKIGLWGTSAGGHLALMEGLTDDNTYIGLDDLKGFSSKVNFIISWYGPTDLSVVKGKNTIRVASNFMGDSIENKKDLYSNASPINYLTKESPSILLIHGNKDNIVPSEQSYFLYKKGKEIGADVRYMSIKNGGHGFVPIGGSISPTLDDISKKTISFIEEKFEN